MESKSVYINCQECLARPMSIFCGLSTQEIDKVGHYKSVALYKKRSVIFNEGDNPHGIYTVNSGKVKIYQLTETGKEQIVRMIRPGDVIGYRALITGEKYSCTAEAIEDSVICFIPKSVFFNMAEENGSISKKLLRLLSIDLRRAENKITTLVDKPVRGRLAEALLFLRETYGMESDNATINIVLTREEIANLAGTTKETAIRLLTELKDEKILEFSGKKIKIKNIPSLVSLANVCD
jgi:CRP/FNR family transcriptional regulator, polysaccharide utilization system transcription regulator